MVVFGWVRGALEHGQHFVGEDEAADYVHRGQLFIYCIVYFGNEKLFLFEIYWTIINIHME